MKKVIATLVLVLGFLTVSFAQKGKKEKFEKFTPEQRTELAIKKMTLKLDLTPKQVSQIKPLIADMMADRKTMREQRKALKESGKKLSADERYEKANEKLDKQIAFKAEMKRVLNEKQYEKFEKIGDRLMHGKKKHLKKKKAKRKHKRDRE